MQRLGHQRSESLPEVAPAAGASRVCGPYLRAQNAATQDLASASVFAYNGTV